MTIDRKIMNLQQNDDLWIDVIEFNKLLDQEPTPEIFIRSHPTLSWRLHARLHYFR